nr:hypothetical protein BaRGS_025464 [Batillaria attramentaria]
MCDRCSSPCTPKCEIGGERVQLLLITDCRIYIPTVVCFGLLGNVLCFATLVFSSLRNTSTCVYMAAIAVLDSIILVLDLCVLIRGFLGHAEFYMADDWACGFHNFLFYFSIHFDVLLLLAMTIDRFIVVKFPLKAQRLCTSKSAMKAIVLIGLFSFALNFQIVFTRRLSPTGNEVDPLKCWHPDPEIYTWIDASIYSFIPFLTLLVLNILIIRQVHASRKFQKDRANVPRGTSVKVVANDGDSADRSSVYTVETNVSTDNVNMESSQAWKKASNSDKSKASAATSNANVTMMLLLVSFTFLLLTSPVVIVLLYKRYYWLPSTPLEKARARLTHAFVDNLMYTNHAVNFLLYCISGRRFREELKRLVVEKLLQYDINEDGQLSEEEIELGQPQIQKYLDQYFKIRNADEETKDQEDAADENEDDDNPVNDEDDDDDGVEIEIETYTFVPRLVNRAEDGIGVSQQLLSELLALEQGKHILDSLIRTAGFRVKSVQRLDELNLSQGVFLDALDVLIGNPQFGDVFGAVLAMELEQAAEHSLGNFFEQKSVLAALLSISTIPTMIQGGIHRVQQIVFAAIKRVVSNKSMRETGLAWLAAVLSLNELRTSSLSDDSEGMPGACSDGFMLNLCGVLLEFFLPISADRQKLLKVDLGYSSSPACRLNYDFEACLAGGQIVSDKGQERKVGMLPTELQGQQSFITECFHLVQRALSVGVIPAIKHYNKMHRFYSSQRQMLAGTDREEAVKNMHLLITVVWETCLLDTEMARNITIFYISQATLLLEAVKREEEKEGDEVEKHQRKVLSVVPEFCVKDMAQWFTFLTTNVLRVHPNAVKGVTTCLHYTLTIEN